MSWFLSAFSRSIGKKQLVAVSGLALSGFLVVHLAGNCFLYAGQAAFDGYAAALESKPYIVWPGRAGLLVLFLVHVGLAIRLTYENRLARPVHYAVRGSRGGRTAASATMFVSGVVVFVFILLHLTHFTLGERIDDSLYKLVVTTFKKPLYVTWYVIAVCVLGLHVSHGLQSACRTLGLDNDKYGTAIRVVSRAFGAVVALGYSALPVYAYLVVELP